MDCAEQRQQEDDVMEVPEVDGDLLAELLDESLEADEAGGQLCAFTADVEGDGWDSQELNHSIHPHDDCEDCGLDGILTDFELDGCGCSRSPPPYVVFFDDDPAEWTETAEGALGPFTGEGMGEWYMDGMVMEWEEDGGNGMSFEFCYGDEVGTEQVYGSPLWE